MKTTLNKIREHNPCKAGWEKLLTHLGKTQADDEPLGILTILDNNGLDDALWCLRAVTGHDREIRLFAVWCARQAQHLMSDPRSRAALDVAERYARGRATDAELAAAYAAARAADASADAAAAAAYAATTTTDVYVYAAAACAVDAVSAAAAADADAAFLAAARAVYAHAATYASAAAAAAAYAHAADAASSAVRAEQEKELRRVCGEEKQ